MDNDCICRIISSVILSTTAAMPILYNNKKNNIDLYSKSIIKNTIVNVPLDDKAIVETM